MAAKKTTRVKKSVKEKKLASYKKVQMKVASQLGYGSEVVKKIELAESETAVDRILISARKRMHD